ncbi:MAG TPA: hypothetical protein VFA55_00845, partial [Candidatus Kapabacteria bacterium]|nr:hypothetical protein [Candidatus Kapabacteria bacterium]
MRRIQCTAAAYYAAVNIIVVAVCSFLLWIGVISCKDPITTNDPRQEIIDTKVALVVTTTPVSAAHLVQWDTSIITVTVYDTNQNTGITVISASVTGRDQKYFKVIDAAKFPISIKAKDSAT